MRCGENNRHVHDGNEKEMALSSDVNDTDKDKSNNSIVHKFFHKPSLENIYMGIFSNEGLLKGSCTMELFDSSSSVSLTSDDGAISSS